MPRLCLTALALLTGQFASSQLPPTETDRLVATGKLWITIKYFHPYLAYRDIDWDKALVDALPKIRSAGDSARYASAIQSMLDELNDPTTYVIAGTPSQRAACIKIENKANGILVISQSTDQPAVAPAQQIKTALESARNVVFDLRGGDFLSSVLDHPDVQAALTPIPLNSSAQRTWVHDGNRSGFYTRAGPRIVGDPNAIKRKLVFLLGDNSVLPRIGSALLASGSAAVLSESPHYRFADVDTISIPMGNAVEVVARLSEPAVSLDVKRVSHDRAMDEACNVLAHGGATRPGTALPLYPSPQPDHAYTENRYPSTEYRILAAYKIWGVIHYFFAYRDLMDEDWDDLFPTFIPKFIAAKNAREYNLLIAELMTHAADSHTTAESEELAEYFGTAPVGLRLRLVEKKPIITEVLDDDAKRAGVQVGDIVAKVDGESIVDRFNRQSPYVAASTPQWHGYRVIERILDGPENSIAMLTIGGQDGRTREINLKRSSTYLDRLRYERTGEITNLLRGNIGYADLDRLTPNQVDNMFESFRNTKAIIFDMRGFPQGTAESIAPRLTEEPDVATGIFTGPLLVGPDLPNGERLTSNASYFFVQRLPTTGMWKYKGKTVMLLDERTIGEGEHTGLLLEAANKTEFIGTPSAGADGDIMSFIVPGGVTIKFSGRDVRHANGGKLQRLGLQPAVSVAPTINGIRHGRDEVLESAIEYVSK